MGWQDTHVEVSEMFGQTFKRVRMTEEKDEVIFENDEVRYVLYHRRDCCESVYVEDITGDLEDLEGWPLLIANEVHNADKDPLSDSEDSYTWTFYNFATYKGYVTIRFYGTSNGYYSESVDCRKEALINHLN